MGKNSKIEWCTHTFNPWLGCAKVSAGCKYCYAETLMDTRWGRVDWGPGGTRVKTKEHYWDQPYKWDAEARKNGTRPKVFCGSLCDVFEDRPELGPWRANLFSLIENTPRLDWLLLTKRPENMAEMATRSWFYPFPSNVWIGGSVEDQENADLRIPLLVQTDASKRFLSIEPQIGPIKIGLAGTAPASWGRGYTGIQQLIDWVIVGGESGHAARPFDLAWGVYIVSECTPYTPVFVKQIGDNPVLDGEPFESEDGKPLVAKGHDPRQWPALLRRREFPEV